MKQFLRRLLPLVAAVILIELTKALPSWSAFYARSLYPGIRSVLDTLFSWLPFSLYDLLILAAIIAAAAGLAGLFIHRYRRRAAEALVIGLGWLYVGFYALWGINYFAPGFYARSGLSPRGFDEAEFRAFLSDYSDSLNASFAEAIAATEAPATTAATADSTAATEAPADTVAASLACNVNLDSLVRTESLRPDIARLFPALPDRARVKAMLGGELYAKMGVRGYFGPFTGEAHVSPHLLEWERPFVTAHELAHKAGIAHEAEANLYAYLLTTGSHDPFSRFSGYYGLLSYVASNARATLSPDDYAAFLQSIDPRVMVLAERSRTHWVSLYSPTLGAVQDRLYEFYLKNNNIPSGQKNYSEVVGMVVALRAIRPVNL